MAKSGLKHIDVGNELTKTEWESEDSHELVHGNAFPGTPVERQLFYRDDEHKWYIYNGSAWVWLGGGSGSGATTFLQLTDTPSSYEGQAGKYAKVKATEDALEFSAAAGGMEVHGNEYHDPDFEQSGVAASLIASHAAIDDAHHSRYTDAEAEAVAGAEVESHCTSEVHSLAQPPQAHKTTHQNGGSDELSLAGLSGDPADTINKSLLTTRGDIIYRDASAAARLAKGTEGQFLQMGANDPAWADHKDLSTGVHGVGTNYLAYTKGSQKEALYHNNYMARATLSTRQENILDATFVKVNLDTKTFDPGSNFDTTNHRYVAPVAGYYLITGVVVYYWSGLVLNKEYYTVIRINGADYMVLPITPSVACNIGYLAVSLAHLDASDYVELWAWINVDVGAGDPTTVDIYEGTSRTQLTTALYQAD